MLTEYSLWLHRDNGNKIMPLDTAINFEWTKAVNGIGSFMLHMPHDFDMRQIVNDQRVAIWRTPSGAAAYREFYGLVRKEQTKDTFQTYTIGGYDFNYILKGHSVLYAASTANVDKTGYHDDLMKAFIRENIGPDVTGPDMGREISSTYWSVEADLSLGAASTSRNGYVKNIYDLCLALALESRNAGTDLYFDVVPVTDAKVEFRVYKNQRGADRTTSGQVYVFSPDFGNVENPDLVTDATDEANYIYAIGNHPKDATNAKTASDTARNTASIWAWREKVIDARSVITNAQRQAMADSALVDGRVRSVFKGTLVSTDYQRYGIDWNLGDKIKLSYADRQYTAMIRTIHGVIDANGHERIEGGLEVYSG